MIPSLSPGSAKAFFLPAATGQRFCLYHHPDPARTTLGAVLYVHPFAEEMNRSRAIVAGQARALAAAGVGVLQVDLFGCGDSSGDFGDATWETWKDDLHQAHAWLARRTEGPVGIWGLRLGASLALEFARDLGQQIRTALLWQPVVRGDTFLTQFLRVHLGSEMNAGDASRRKTTSALRADLAQGKHVEVAGYALNPRLAKSIDGIDLLHDGPVETPVHWFNLASPAQASPPSARVAPAWRDKGVTVHEHSIAADPFWLWPENAHAAALIDETTTTLLREFELGTHGKSRPLPVPG